MDTPSRPISPDFWLRQMLSARAALDGGVVRRKVRDVDRIMGRAAFEAEMRRRGYTVVENASQYVIFCNHQEVRVVVQANSLPRNLPRPLAKVLAPAERDRFTVCRGRVKEGQEPDTGVPGCPKT